MKKLILLLSLSCLIFYNYQFTYSQEFSFTAMSDSRGNYDGVNKPVLSGLINHMLENQKDVKFLFFVGDMIDGSKKSDGTTLNQLENWKQIMSPVYNSSFLIKPKIYPVIGNHEVQNPIAENVFREVFNLFVSNGPEDEKGLTGSFDYGNVHFVYLDTERWYYGNPSDPSDDRRDWHTYHHLDWLKNDLKEARERKVRFIFVLAHEMPFPVGGHLHDGLPNLTKELTLPLDSTRQWYLSQRDSLWSLLVQYDVTAFISGHEHLYARQSVDGVYQIVAGSSGAPLYGFNPVYSDEPDVKKPLEEMSYTKAKKYYQVLGYNYGPGKNSQRSEDFVGIRAFHYVKFNVKKDKIVVQMFGAPPKKGTDNVMSGKIKLLDEFEIIK